MRVQVDEPGGDDQAVGVEGADRRLVDLVDGDDPPVANPDVTGAGRGARAVDDGRGVDAEVEHGAERTPEIGPCNRGREVVASNTCSYPSAPTPWT